jgi:hypothetical protein
MCNLKWVVLMMYIVVALMIALLIVENGNFV